MAISGEDLEDNIERFNFFPHLTKAGMIDGGATGIDTLSESAISNNPELIYPATPFDVYIAVSSGNSVYATKNLGNFYVIPAYVTASETESLPPRVMSTIDTKFDDGKMHTGDIRLGSEIGGCPYGTDNDYDLDAPTLACEFIIKAAF